MTCAELDSSGKQPILQSWNIYCKHTMQKPDSGQQLLKISLKDFVSGKVKIKLKICFQDYTLFMQITITCLTWYITPWNLQIKASWRKRHNYDGNLTNTQAWLWVQSLESFTNDTNACAVSQNSKRKTFFSLYEINCYFHRENYIRTAEISEIAELGIPHCFLAGA